MLPISTEQLCGKIFIRLIGGSSKLFEVIKVEKKTFFYFFFFKACKAVLGWTVTEFERLVLLQNRICFNSNEITITSGFRMIHHTQETMFTVQGLKSLVIVFCGHTNNNATFFLVMEIHSLSASFTNETALRCQRKPTVHVSLSFPFLLLFFHSLTLLLLLAYMLKNRAAGRADLGTKRPTSKSEPSPPFPHFLCAECMDGCE